MDKEVLEYFLLVEALTNEPNTANEAAKYEIAGYELDDKQEYLAVLFAGVGDQKELNKIPWAVIDRLIKRGILQEVWKPFMSKIDDPEIRLVEGSLSVAKQSTNRI